MMDFTPKDRMVAALERKAPLPGLVPHWELVFCPTMEAFGRINCIQRNYAQWDQMSESERELQKYKDK